MELIEVLYRISLSIGNGTSLEEMLQEALCSYYENLALEAVIVFSLDDPENKDHFRPTGSFPAGSALPSAMTEVIRILGFSDSTPCPEEYMKNLPIKGTVEGTIHYAVQELKDYGLIIMTRSGSPFPLSLLAGLTPLNSRLASACLSCLGNEILEREIKFRKAAEEALLRSEKRLDLALQVTDDGLWDWNLEEDVVYFSPTYYTMLGYEPYEFLPSFEKWKELVHPEDVDYALKKVMSCMENRGEGFEMEFRLASRSGEWIWILGRGKVVERDKEGNPRRMVGTHVNITSRKETEEKMERLNRELYISASTDRITGLLNRQRFDDILAQEMERASRYENPLSILMFDLDNFKLINDTFGHQKGDSILQDIAGIIRENIRSTDFAARWGGDEFVVLALADLNNAFQLGEKLRKGISLVNLPGLGDLTISMGIAEFIQTDTLHSLVKRVDDALYRAKQNGKNRVET